MKWAAKEKGCTAHAIDIIRQKYTLCGLRVGNKWKIIRNPRCEKCKSIIKAKARSRARYKRDVHLHRQSQKT